MADATGSHVADSGPVRIGKTRSFREYAGLILRGICMGSADVIPGVSGGTMAFILGIYEELIASIRMLGRPEFFRPLVKFRWGEAARAINLPFLASVLTGVMVAVLSLTRLIRWLLDNQPVFLWSFFFGLVLASVFVVARRIRRWTAMLWGAMIIGTVGAYLLVGLVPLQTPTAPWFLFLSGALAICAMILPGISGAFILLILGKYLYIVDAVNELNIAPIAFVGAGAVVGLVSFAQVLNWLFRRYHDLTVALLTGLMLGSLRKVWPWKVTVDWVTDPRGEQIPTIQNNVLPDFTVAGNLNGEVVTALLLAVAGFLLVIVLERVAGGNNKKGA